MFPDYLDGAKVLEYTANGHYGFLTDYDENGTPMEKEICFLAICHYEGREEGFYLFSCDSQYDVLVDTHLYTVEQCRHCADLPEGTVWNKK